jgi:ABC-2 type transport system ATP-binding protein
MATPQGEANPRPEDGTIVFQGLARRFGRRMVLRDLSLKVRPGEIHALLGRNGCGKTTALRILLGFLEPHAGRASILGVDSQRLTPADRGRIGYVSENHRFYPLMRVREAVAFEAGTRPRFDRGFADAAIVRCALPPELRVLQLSRGQRAQLSIILAVAARPEVLVLDDPALGLDVVMRRELLEAMIDILADRGLSVLFSSHFLDDVERVADRVSILHEGSLIADATTDELKRRVCQRTWTPPPADSAAAERRPPAVPGLLRAERRRSGYSLTLLDCDEAMEAALAQEGARLGMRTGVSLEDLFLALTRSERDRLIPPFTQQTEAAA